MSYLYPYSYYPYYWRSYYDPLVTSSVIDREIAVETALRRSRIEAELAASRAATESALRRSRIEQELATQRHLRRSRLEEELDASRRDSAIRRSRLIQDEAENALRRSRREANLQASRRADEDDYRRKRVEGDVKRILTQY